MRATPVLIGALALAGTGLVVASSNPREPGPIQAQAQPAAPRQAPAAPAPAVAPAQPAAAQHVRVMLCSSTLLLFLTALEREKANPEWTGKEPSASNLNL